MIPQEITNEVIFRCSEIITTDFRILTTETLSGGCINNVKKIHSNHGDFCVKYNNKASFPGIFETEACGLLILKAAGNFRVPGVICTGDTGGYSYIILEYISEGKRVNNFMEDFGRSLAQMHLNSEDYFGLDHDNYMGSLPQSNLQKNEWVAFFVSERLQKQVEISNSRGLLSSHHLSSFKQLYKKLDSLLTHEPPALLHGDLWSGNFMISEEGKACLIDPAVYYGHREADLAMTKLFGGFDEDFYQSYNETYALQKGWEERILIYQLYPLLIHLNLFGKSYLSRIENTLSQIL